MGFSYLSRLLSHLFCRLFPQRTFFQIFPITWSSDSNFRVIISLRISNILPSFLARFLFTRKKCILAELVNRAYSADLIFGFVILGSIDNLYIHWNASRSHKHTCTYGYAVNFQSERISSFREELKIFIRRSYYYPLAGTLQVETRKSLTLG